jgi:hypothetical protein
MVRPSLEACSVGAGRPIRTASGAKAVGGPKSRDPARHALARGQSVFYTHDMSEQSAFTGQRGETVGTGDLGSENRNRADHVSARANPFDDLVQKPSLLIRIMILTLLQEIR